MVLVLALLLLMPSLAYGAQTYYVMADGSSNTTGPATSCESDDTMATIVFATNGDTVQLGATGVVGTDCVWGGDTIGATNSVHINNKAIHLRGAGQTPSGCNALSGSETGCGSAGQTIITVAGTCTGNCDSVLFIDEAANEGTVAGAGIRVSNIEFRSTTASSATSGGQAPIVHRRRSGGKMTIIDHVNIKIIGRTDGGGMVWDFNRGLVHSSIFETDQEDSNNSSAFDIIPADTSACADWGTASTMGLGGDPSGNLNIYIENNIMKRHAENIDRSGVSRTDIRNNYIINANIAGHGWDSQICGWRHSQLIDNHFVCSGNGNIYQRWTEHRGATAIMAGNIYDQFNLATCGVNAGVSSTGHAIEIVSRRLKACDAIPGWPGESEEATHYPLYHQPGWGYTSGGTTDVGESRGMHTTASPQDLEPIYIFGNTNNSGGRLINVEQTAFETGNPNTGYTGVCRAMSTSANSKTTGTSMTLQRYLSANQPAVVAFADLMGGSSPTISSDINDSWILLQQATHGTPNAAGDSMRLSLWCIGSGGACTRASTSGMMTVTIAFSSSAKARAGVIATPRGVTNSSPMDANAAIIEDDTSTYTAPSSGVLAQTSEAVIGYFALNGPGEWNASSPKTLKNDTIAAGSSDVMAIANISAGTGLGANGTTGGDADSNVVVAITYRKVSATTAVSPTITNSTANRRGLAGTLSFKVDGDPDLQATEIIQPNREYYHDDTSLTGEVDCTAGGANCNKGIGSGTRANRPANCVAGTAYASSDFPGTLDKCTATNTWTNAWWTKFTYPHPLATLTPGGEGGSSSGDSGISGSVAPRGRPRWHGPHAKPDRLETP